MISTATAAGHAIGACTACGTAIGLEEHQLDQRLHSGGIFTQCPACDARVELRWVYGEASEVPCDGRCMGAVGPVCLCSCGGRNHGRWWLRVELVPSWLAQAAAAQAKRQARHSELTAARAAAAEGKRIARAERIAIWQADQLEAHPELARLGEPLDPQCSAFERDMREGWAAGTLTERQTAATVRMWERDAQRAAQRAAWAEQEAAARAAGVSVPDGRGTYTVTIVATRSGEGAWGTWYRMCVRHADGWRAWGTIPRGLEGDLESMRGREIALTATFAPELADFLAGTFKRPVARSLALTVEL